jgi:hypothetical protein
LRTIVTVTSGHSLFGLTTVAAAAGGIDAIAGEGGWCCYTSLLGGVAVAKNLGTLFFFTIPGENDRGDSAPTHGIFPSFVSRTIALFAAMVKLGGRGDEKERGPLGRRVTR